MESLQNLKRSHYCGTLTMAEVGQEITVMGWVQRGRDKGVLVFVDLRDRTGLLQLAFDEDTAAELKAKAKTLRAEFVVAAVGKLRERSSKNPELPTGDVELEVTELRILAKSETPPFEIVENSPVNDVTRLTYRYLDLRRPDMQRMLRLRHQITISTRNYFDKHGFFEIETPVLTKSTPEGARDYLVPSRVHPNKFYALPQSPQQYKQLLMLAGFDRYIQITRCFRDEDLRADRQPEFTQIDLEMSFVDVEDVLAMNEGFLQTLFKDVLDVEVPLPLPRLTYAEAMERYGSDKPDTRFGFELCNLSDIVADTEFKVFAGALEAGGSVRAICIKGGYEQFPRKQVDQLAEYVKTYRAKGLAWSRISEETSSSYAKFLTEAENAAIYERLGAEKGDLVLIVADGDDEVVFASLGALRCEIARRMNLLDSKQYNFLWVTEFPMFEYSEEENRYMAKHHPFTAPMDEDLHLLEADKKNCRAKAYDIVLNGYELGGGSIRISVPEVQQAMFRALGFTDEEANDRFGHLINAFQYGAPPHGGLAYGLDRIVMLMGGTGDIKDVIAFPKMQNAAELMMSSPDVVEKKQLDELYLALLEKES
jgi:aspartyl-tRNA synthetase, bacterial type